MTTGTSEPGLSWEYASGRERMSCNIPPGYWSGKFSYPTGKTVPGCIVTLCKLDPSVLLPHPAPPLLWMAHVRFGFEPFAEDSSVRFVFCSRSFLVELWASSAHSWCMWEWHCSWHWDSIRLSVGCSVAD